MGGRVSTREVVRGVARRMDCYQKDAKELLEHFASLVVEEVARGRKVRFAPLGTFYTRPARRPRHNGTRSLILEFKPSRAVLKKILEIKEKEGERKAVR